MPTGSGRFQSTYFLARDDRARVAAAHGDDEIRPFDVVTRELAPRDVDVDLLERLDHRLVQLVGRIGAGRRCGRTGRGRASSAECLAKRVDRLGHEPVVRPRP
ncbi:MAG: hypothetical protein ACRDNM_11605, partial [Gaiellaceae bacterium]